MCLRTRADSPSAGGVTTARRGGGIGGYHVARYGLASPPATEPPAGKTTSRPGPRPARGRPPGRARAGPDVAVDARHERGPHPAGHPLASPQWSVDHRHERRAADVVTRFARAHRLLITR